MSHRLGVMCATCREVLEPDDDCPERDCPGGHGFGHQEPNAWAACIWPQHPCFHADSTTPATTEQPDGAHDEGDDRG
jgi:hypothetical protein